MLLDDSVHDTEPSPPPVETIPPVNIRSDDNDLTEISRFDSEPEIIFVDGLVD
jgi:hypothetical protein